MAASGDAAIMNKNTRNLGRIGISTEAAEPLAQQMELGCRYLADSLNQQ
jgi:hypothetical protein